MPIAHRSCLLAALAAVTAACAPPRSPELSPAAMRAAPASRIWLTGESNVRHFTCRARTVTTALALVPGTTVDSVLMSARAAVAGAVSASVELPVEALDCGIGHMSADLHRALRAPAAPTIAFRVAGYTPSPSSALLDGTLEIAGVARPVRVAASLDRPAPGVVRLRGQQSIRPTDFGIAPPRRFFGLLRVRNEVTVHFDVTVVGEVLGTR